MVYYANQKSKYLHVKWSSGIHQISKGLLCRVDPALYRDTICITATSGILFHWPVLWQQCIIGATTATITTSKMGFVWSQLSVTCALKIAHIPSRNNSNGHDAPFFICFHFPKTAQEFAFCGSHLLPQECRASALRCHQVVLSAISWDTWRKPDKDPFPGWRVSMKHFSGWQHTNWSGDYLRNSAFIEHTFSLVSYKFQTI